MNRLNSPPGTGPLLLVSVRNGKEALAALEGGADIIDIKEPKRGSLGKADDAAIREVVETVRSANPTIPLTAALGELKERNDPAIFPCLPAEIGFIKMGLSGCANDGWLPVWLEIRRKLQSDSRSPHLVMVIYADWQQALAPRPKDLIQAAAEYSCGAVLLDTFHKYGRSLLEVLSPRELEDIAVSVHAIGLPLVVAGSLRTEDLPMLIPLAPEVVAIRSAACKKGQREAGVCPKAVRRFRDCLHDVHHWPNSPARENQ